MPMPASSAAARRDQRLARTRRVSLWIAGGAAGAALALGTAFAHALPGHAAPAAGRGPAATQPAPAASAAQPGPQPAASAPHRAAGARPRHHLHPPQQPPASTPASTPAPPVVVSGGS